MARIKEGMSPGVLPTSRNGVPSPLPTGASYRTLHVPARKSASLKSHKEDNMVSVSIFYRYGTKAICMCLVGTNGRCFVLLTLCNYIHSKKAELDTGWYILAPVTMGDPSSSSLMSLQIETHHHTRSWNKRTPYSPIPDGLPFLNRSRKGLLTTGMEKQ